MRLQAALDALQSRGPSEAEEAAADGTQLSSLLAQAEEEAEGAIAAAVAATAEREKHAETMRTRARDLAARSEYALQQVERTERKLQEARLRAAALDKALGKADEKFSAMLDRGEAEEVGAGSDSTTNGGAASASGPSGGSPGLRWRPVPAKPLGSLGKGELRRLWWQTHFLLVGGALFRARRTAGASGLPSPRSRSASRSFRTLRSPGVVPTRRLAATEAASSGAAAAAATPVARRGPADSSARALATAPAPKARPRAGTPGPRSPLRGAALASTGGSASSFNASKGPVTVAARGDEVVVEASQVPGVETVSRHVRLSHDLARLEVRVNESSRVEAAVPLAHCLRVERVQGPCALAAPPGAADSAVAFRLVLQGRPSQELLCLHEEEARCGCMHANTLPTRSPCLYLCLRLCAGAGWWLCRRWLTCCGTTRARARSGSASRSSAWARSRIKKLCRNTTEPCGALERQRRSGYIWSLAHDVPTGSWDRPAAVPPS